MYHGSFTLCMQCNYISGVCCAFFGGLCIKYIFYLRSAGLGFGWMRCPRKDEEGGRAAVCIGRGDDVMRWIYAVGYAREGVQA